MHDLSHLLSDEALEQLSNQLTAFAYAQLGSQSAAQDAVQESLLAAVQSLDKFKGQSAFRSWVFAILKHKIADVLRDKHKHNALHLEQDIGDVVFDEAGHWQASFAPSVLEPDRAAENEAFWQVLELCLQNLPALQGRVFLMKEYTGLDGDEICQTLSLTKQNYYVLMHRAKLQLQVCLSRHWFEGES